MLESYTSVACSRIVGKAIVELLGQRADALILDLAKRYQASKAAELTTVLDAIDSLSEIERLQRPAVGVTAAPRTGPKDPVSQSAEGGSGSASPKRKAPCGGA